ncbi:MAG: NADH-quinone oxidoreductase subunit A [Dehalococcoidia bacterium]|nr:NADH-quinone oxidoreductase subunit A [Dehalococcoidia bacterium]
MFESFLSVALFLLITLAFAGLMLALPVALRRLKIVPHRPNPAKNATYECGLQTIGRSWVQYNPRYYFYAIMMVALDAMAIVVFPWAVRLKELGTPGLIGAFIFIGIIALGYAYAWRKKVLVWK